VGGGDVGLGVVCGAETGGVGVEGGTGEVTRGGTTLEAGPITSSTVTSYISPLTVTRYVFIKFLLPKKRNQIF
jgi:hypothetical protein